MVVIGDENSDINIGENDKLEWGKWPTTKMAKHTQTILRLLP